MSMGVCFHIRLYIMAITPSNQLAVAVRSFIFLGLALHRSAFLLHHCSNCSLEHFLQPLSGQSTAFDVFALELVLNHCLSCLLGDRSCLRILCVASGLFPQIHLIPHEDLDSSRDNSLDLRVPLSLKYRTFLRALVKEEGSMTEKAMRKTSVPG